MHERTEAKCLRCIPVVTAIITVLLSTPSTWAVLDPTDYDWPEEIRDVFGLSPDNVEEGSLGFILDQDCPIFIDKFGTCFGNNPASPYGAYEFSDYPDPADRYRWRLAENQAVLFIGPSPPNARYYSFQAYPFSRHRDNLREEHDPPTDPTCEDGWCCDYRCNAGWFCDLWDLDGVCLIQRRQLVGAMGTNLNHLELVTDGGALCARIHETIPCF